jgi:hypothetical protein
MSVARGSGRDGYDKNPGSFGWPGFFLSRMFRCASRPRAVIDSARGVIDGSPVRKKTL